MCVHVSVSTSVSACVCKHSLSAYYFAQSQPKPTWQLQHSSTLAVDSSSANFECACVQPSSLETCDDECDDMEEEDFHLVVSQGEGCSRTWKKRLLWLPKKCCRLHASQEEAGNTTDENAADDESSDSGSGDEGVESTGTGQMQSLVACMHTHNISMLDLQFHQWNKNFASHRKEPS